MTDNSSISITNSACNNEAIAVSLEEPVLNGNCPIKSLNDRSEDEIKIPLAINKL